MQPGATHATPPPAPPSLKKTSYDPRAVKFTGMVVATPGVRTVTVLLGSITGEKTIQGSRVVVVVEGGIVVAVVFVGKVLLELAPQVVKRPDTTAVRVIKFGAPIGAV